MRRLAARERWEYDNAIGSGGETKQYFSSSFPPKIRKIIEAFEKKERIKEIKADLSKDGMQAIPEMFKDEKKRAMLTVCAKIQAVPYGITKHEWVRLLAKETGKHPATLYRWVEKFNKNPVSFSNKQNTLSININSRTFEDPAIDWAVSEHLSDLRKPKRDLYQLLKIEAGKQNWQIGSEKTFYRILKKIKSPLIDCARGGRKAIEQQMPRIESDITVFHVMERLVGDQHIGDHVIVDRNNIMVTPAMYAWVDLRSRFFTGLYPSISSYNAYDVGMALRESCEYGIAKEMYTDNGKPEISKHLLNIRHQLNGLATFGELDWIEDRLPDDFYGMNHKKARVRNPQSKIIESLFWHAIEANLIKQGVPGYAKRSQNEYENLRAQKEIKRLHKQGKLLNANEYFAEVKKAVDTWNGHLMQTESIIPEKYFFDHIANAPIAHLDGKTLDFIFLPSAARVVRKSMVRIKLPGYGVCNFYSRDLFPLSKPANKPGIKVEVRFNPYDPQKVYILDIDKNKLICIAERWGKINPKDPVALSSKIREQMGLVSYWEKLTRQQIKKARQVVRYSPYTPAARKISAIEKFRKKMPSDEATDLALIEAYARSMGT
ncbi:MAG: Mu transposase C-terminal domain-containing protein [Deltaproteobacteria bacterium]|nr:Mu transposase C-terminal domain-containing protein [Deltaproteobacteria bacterium]